MTQKSKNQPVELDIANWPITMVPLDQLIQSDLKIREYKEDDERAIALKLSIAADGVMDATVCRAVKDDPKYVEMIDGLHRWKTCTALGIGEIPCKILPFDTSDDTCKRIQFNSNRSRVTQTKKEESEMVRAWMMQNPYALPKDAAEQFRLKQKDVYDYLSLNKLSDKSNKLLENDKLSLAHATALSRVKSEASQNKIIEGSLQREGDKDIPFLSLPIGEFTEVCRRFEKADRAGIKPKIGPLFRPRTKKELEMGMDQAQFTVESMQRDDPENEDLSYHIGCLNTFKWIGRMDDASVKAAAEAKTKTKADSLKADNEKLKAKLAASEAALAKLETSAVGIA